MGKVMILAAAAIVVVALLGPVACREDASEQELAEMATSRDRALEYRAQYYDGVTPAVGISWDAGQRIDDKPWPFTSPLAYRFVAVDADDCPFCSVDVTKLGSGRYQVAFEDGAKNVYWVEADIRSGALTESGNWFGTIVAAPPGSDFDACLQEQYSPSGTCVPLDAGTDADMLARINGALGANSEVSIVGTVVHEDDAIRVTVTELNVQETGTPEK
jgi:hypothetical protein